MNNRIYLASSWKNKQLVDIIDSYLSERNFECYNFTKPYGHETGFNWKELGLDIPFNELHRYDDKLQYKISLTKHESIVGFINDRDALNSCDICVLILPCGKSAHLNLGYAVGQNKKTIIYWPDNVISSAELMYKFCNEMVFSIEDLYKSCKLFRDSERKL